MSFFHTEELHREKQSQRGKRSEADGLITMVAFLEAEVGDIIWWQTESLWCTLDFFNIIC